MHSNISENSKNIKKTESKRMKVLLCSEFYSPSVGGVQIVIQQIAERLAADGHEVIVATSTLKERAFEVLNGVQVIEFDVRGNLVNGLSGEIRRYREFIKSFDGDAILVKAAQQWTFDAIWDELRITKARKIFIPCGFSCLYEEAYGAYYKYLPEVLKIFDHLIFYSNDYRDINFVDAHNIKNRTVLSNGADEAEFSTPIDPGFRSKLGIEPEAFLMLNVASLSILKGQSELIDAFEMLPETDKKLYLLINCNVPEPKNRIRNQNSSLKYIPGISQSWMDRIWKVQLLLSTKYFINVLRACKDPFKLHSGLMGINQKLNLDLIESRPPSKIPPKESLFASVLRRAEIINNKFVNKKVLIMDLPRADLIQAYLSANLFVSASHLEYSPLVLFEAAASGTPFLSSSAGNANELVGWFGGGFVFDSPKDDEGYCLISPEILAAEINVLVNQPEYLRLMGNRMRDVWMKHFTWGSVYEKYKKILINV